MKMKKVKPLTNWKAGDLCRFKFDGFDKVLIITKIDGYNTVTGELHMQLMDEKTGEKYNSAYDKNRFKVEK